MRTLDRRTLLRTGGATLFTAPFWQSLLAGEARATTGAARRVIFFYFPDGVSAPSWHTSGSETSFSLSHQQSPLEPFKDDCIFFRGLSLGPTDAGSHPGGAKKLLTAVDGGYGESIDQVLARTAGASSPFRHLYLGVMANQNNASGDKHISYTAPGSTVAPEDDPSRAFSRLFGSGATRTPVGSSTPPRPRTSVTVIDAMLSDLRLLESQLGTTERRKLDLHLEALREVEARIKSEASPNPAPATCEDPALSTSIPEEQLYAPERFPEILRAQMDLMVQAMACGLTKVGVIQCSHHTSELIMSRFPMTEMSGSRDMRSHEASHYGGSQELQGAYIAQRRWFVSQFAYLLDALRQRPEGDGTMLDHSLVLFASEVCDGNDHQHDNMPFILGGHGGGAVRTGRFLSYGYERHGGLLAAIGQAMGAPIDQFGGTGPLGGVLA